MKDVRVQEDKDDVPNVTKRSRSSQSAENEADDLQAHRRWAWFLTRPLMFFYAFTTRLPFVAVALYGAKDLHLKPQALAIGGIVFFSIGRSIAAYKVRGDDARSTIHYPLFTLLAWILLGTAMPAIHDAADGGANKRGGALTIAIFWILSLMTGLAETISALDFWLKRELSSISILVQEREFRNVLVFVALGSAGSFFCSFIFQYAGWLPLTMVAVASSLVQVALTAFYVENRGHVALKDCDDGSHGNHKASCGQQHSSRAAHRFSGWISKDWIASLTAITCPVIWRRRRRGGDNDDATLSVTTDGNRETEMSNRTLDVSDIDCERDGASPSTRTHTKSSSLARLPQAVEDKCTTYIAYLHAMASGLHLYEHELSDFGKIELPTRFRLQQDRAAIFCILSLSCGAANISTMFAAFVLYMNDVWHVSESQAGSMMAIGELGTMLLLYVLGMRLHRQHELQAKSSHAGNEARKVPATASSGVLESLMRYTIDQPSLQILGTLFVIFGNGAMGFVGPRRNKLESDTADVFKPHDSTEMTLCVCAAVSAMVGNLILHSSGAENIVTYTGHDLDLFQRTLSRGYSGKRMVNVIFALIATILYSAVGPHAPFLGVHFHQLSPIRPFTHARTRTARNCHAAQSNECLCTFSLDLLTHRSHAH